MFNNKERNSNILRISAVSTAASIIHIVVQFLYRTLFLVILSKEYLGIEGLFSNVIQVLSLAELGIGAVIAYKLYEPIKSNDVVKVALLMNFYRKIYLFVAMIVLAIGIVLLPFLKFLVKDVREIPGNVDFYFVYSLYLFQSVSSYFFTYKQTLLAADQRGDILALFTTGSTIFRMILQIIVLQVTKDYQFMLATGILCGIVLNWLFSEYITRKYPIIWDKNADMDEEIKKSFFKDLKSMLCHKIGGTALGATDNIVLSALVGLGQLGIYSNYSLILSSINKILNKLLGNFTASLGNASLSMDNNKLYSFYEKLLMINHMIANIITVCVYILINPFIAIWQDGSMVFGSNVVVVICVCFYISADRIINNSFIDACGLFRKDVIRPLIECFINVVASIMFTLQWGIVGVFLGTVLSHLCTVWWRSPYLLYKYIFDKRIWRYWFLYFRNVFLVIAESIIIQESFMLTIDSYQQWILQGIITFCIVATVNFIIYWKLFISGWSKIMKRIAQNRDRNR